MADANASSAAAVASARCFCPPTKFDVGSSSINVATAVATRDRVKTSAEMSQMRNLESKMLRSWWAAVSICVDHGFARPVIGAAQESPWGPATALGVFLWRTRSIALATTKTIRSARRPSQLTFASAVTDLSQTALRQIS